MAKTMSELREGRKLPGDCGSELTSPEWLEPRKYHRGRELLQENIFATLFCHVGGLIMLVNLPNIHKPLETTGNSSSLVASFQRYLQTLTHIKSWYDTDIFDTSSEGFKSIKCVRDLHRKVASSMERFEAKSTESSKDSEVWISQWDMAVTQFAFLGMMVLHPDDLGFAHLSHQDKEAILHCWRAIGYQLGIDDKYNLYGSGNFEIIEKLCQSIESDVFRASLTANWPDGLRMGKMILESIRTVVWGLTYHGFMKFWSDIVGIRYLVRLSVSDWLSYGLMNVVFRMRLFSVGPLRKGFNRLLLHAIEKASKRTMSIYKDLCVRDNKGGIQVATCPFAAYTSSSTCYPGVYYAQSL